MMRKRDDEIIGLQELLERQLMEDDRPLTVNGPVVTGIVNSLVMVQQMLSGQQGEIIKTTEALTAVRVGLAEMTTEIKHLSEGNRNNAELLQRMTRLEERQKAAEQERSNLSNFSRFAVGLAFTCLLTVMGIAVSLLRHS